MSPSSRHGVGWGWLIVAVAAATIVLLLDFGLRVGFCVDYAPESGARSTCTTGPVTGVARE